MKGRGVIILNRDFSAEWYDLLKDCNINRIGLHSLYQNGGLQGHLEWLQSPYVCDLIAKFEKGGFEVLNEVHAVDWLLPRKLYEEHKSWFRMNENGERVKDWNFCVSNEDALEYVENSAYNLAVKLKQNSEKYGIWSDDCVNSVCHCEKCSKLNGADQNMIIMKAVLRGLKRYDASAKLGFLSYQDALTVPNIAPDKDMFLEFAPIDRNHFVAMEAADDKNKKNRDVLEKMLKIFSAESAQILEYFLDVSLFCQWKRENAGPLHLSKERLDKDIRYYKSLGIENITTFTGFMDKEWREKFGVKDIEIYGRTINEI